MANRSLSVSREGPALAYPSQAELSPKTLDYLEIGYLFLLAVFVGVAWLGFTLAEFGIDRPWIVLGLGGLGGIVGLVRLCRSRWRSIGLSDALGLLVPLGIGGILDFPPDEWILGALDPGSYVNAGATIARSGSIVLHDPLLASLSPPVHQALFPFPASRLPGFYLTTLRWIGFQSDGWEVPVDRVVPHGFHLYPVVLSFGYALGGVRTELLVTPILALFGLAGFYLLGRRLFGTGVAAIGASFLALSPAEVWFARYPAAEILAQVLFFGGLLAFVATIDHPHPVLAVLAGAALGAVHLAKIETFPLPFLVAVFFGYQALAGRFNRRWLPFLAVYALVVVQAVLHAAIFASWYTVSSFDKTVSLALLIDLALLLLLIVVVAVALGTIAPAREQVRKFLARVDWPRGLGIVAPIGIGVAALYLYFLRPLQVIATPETAASVALLARVNDAQSFVRLGWYVGTVGLALGTLGWMLVAYREHDRRVALPLLLFAVDTALFLTHMDITPVHYWAARRWITLVIPGFCLATGYLLARLFPRSREYGALVLLPICLILGLGYQLLPGLTPLVGYVEYNGAVDQLGALAAAVPSNAIVMFPDGDAGERFSTPLNYLYDRTSVLVYNDPTVDAAAGQAARTWLAQGRPVYWIELANGKGPSQIGLRGPIVGRQHISLVEKLAVSDHPPGADGLFQQDLAIWKIERP